jgi:hypothetical protein
VPRTRTETPKAAPFRRWTKQQRADQSRATGPTEKLQEWGRELAGARGPGGAGGGGAPARSGRRCWRSTRGRRCSSRSSCWPRARGSRRRRSPRPGRRPTRRASSPSIYPPPDRISRSAAAGTTGKGRRKELSLSLLLLLGRGNSICSVSSLSLARALDLFRGGVPGYVEVACLVAVRREREREGGRGLM